MYKKVFLLFIVFIPSFIFAHSLLLEIFDNEDGTMTASGVFSTGEVARGAQIRLESINSGKVLYKKRLPDEGELTIKIPDIAYKVILDGGPGHKITKDGIAPIGGFKKELVEEKSIKTPPKEEKISRESIILISMITASLLFLLTIVIGILNTNRLVKELEKSKAHS